MTEQINRTYTFEEKCIMWIPSRMLLWLEQCIEIPEATKETATICNIRYIWNLLQQTVMCSIRYVIFKLLYGVVFDLLPLNNFRFAEKIYHYEVRPQAACKSNGTLFYFI